MEEDLSIQICWWNKGSNSYKNGRIKTICKSTYSNKQVCKVLKNSPFCDGWRDETQTICLPKNNFEFNKKMLPFWSPIQMSIAITISKIVISGDIWPWTGAIYINWRKLLLTQISPLYKGIFLLVLLLIGLGNHFVIWGDCRGRDRMVVGFTTTCAISAHHH